MSRKPIGQTGACLAIETNSIKISGRHWRVPPLILPRSSLGSENSDSSRIRPPPGPMSGGKHLAFDGGRAHRARSLRHQQTGADLSRRQKNIFWQFIIPAYVLTGTIAKERSSLPMNTDPAPSKILVLS